MIDDELEHSRMPLLDHLIELRRRLIICVVGIVALFFVCYWMAPQIYQFLVQPLADALAAKHEERRMIFTALHEAFFTYLKVAFFAAMFLSFPIIATQVWKFVAPGLYRDERRAFLPFLIATPILFFMGGAMAYYVVFPLAWKFFLGFEMTAEQGLPIQLEAKVDQYLSLVMQLIFAFGLCFEMPVVMTLLARAGLITSEAMRSKRRYAIVVAFIFAAVMTPPDVLSQVSLAIPTIVLYEISIWSVRFVERSRGAEAANAIEDEDDAPSTTQ
ncbi:MAG: twin-arginine translocase subunit TatC [Rhodospirillales bacterium]|nr:twin-arginine translocase subunit TatC [Rhodospirillales bacterium]